MWENKDVFKSGFNLKINFFLILSSILISAQVVQATDKELAAKLKDELEFETKRRNDFKNQDQGKKIYEQEREKGLSLFLEEQEKWDLTREKGLNEQRASRLKMKEMSEASPEYLQDQKQKQKYENDIEIARQKQIETKLQVSELFKNKVEVTEEEELNIYNHRPRYALRARGSNKWTAKGKTSSGSSSSSPASGGSWDSGNSGSSGSAPFDYPPIPNQDYVPSDNFEDLPPPPPMMPYEGYGAPGGMPFEGGGEFPPPTGYPPPPPDGGWDF